MSLYRFIDHPRYVARLDYQRVLNRMVNKVRRQQGVRAVYQIGGVSTPGISDLDMVVVFEDGVYCRLNPLEGLSEKERYLFTHSLYGTSRSLFDESQDYSFFHNYKLLWGSNRVKRRGECTAEEEKILKVQIALEYLLRLYVALVVQRVYRVFKLRSFFLHVKAVRYDLDFLGIESGTIRDLTEQLVGWRSDWFDERPSTVELIEALDTFFDELRGCLAQHVSDCHFYLPALRRYRLARSIWLEPGEEIHYRRRGVLLPRVLSRVGPRYFSLQNRVNEFSFELPITVSNMPSVLDRRFRVVKEMQQYNQRHLPHFTPLTSSLHIF